MKQRSTGLDWTAALYRAPVATGAQRPAAKDPRNDPRNDLGLLRANLGQVRALVTEATESVGREFELISRDIRRLQALDHLPPGVGRDAEREALAISIDKRIASLVVSLQFGDIVNQLLEFTDRQAVEVEQHLLGSDGLQLSDGSKPTLQTSLQSGDLELF